MGLFISSVLPLRDENKLTVVFIDTNASRGFNLVSVVYTTHLLTISSQVLCHEPYDHNLCWYSWSQGRRLQQGTTIVKAKKDLKKKFPPHHPGTYFL